MTNVMSAEDFSGLTVARFDVRLRALEPVSLPPFLGSTLRGALGHALKQAVCVVDHNDCSRCPVAPQCVYPRFFETRVPPGIEHLQGQQYAPLPFILEPPIVRNPLKRVWRLPARLLEKADLAASHTGQHGAGAQRTITTFECLPDEAARDDAVSARKPSIVSSVVLPDQAKKWNAGEDLSFGLTLLGQAIEFLPYIIFAIASMARRGLGADRSPFELKEIRLKRARNATELIYPGEDSSLTVHSSVDCPLSELISERLTNLRSQAANAEDARIPHLAAQLPSRTIDEAIAERLDELRAAILNASVSGQRDQLTWAIETGCECENGDSREQSSKREPRLKLRFLTPARIRVQGDLQTTLPFELLIRSLLRRISALSSVHGRSHLDLDYRGLIWRARSVRTCRSLLKWWDLGRYSNRQNEKLKVGGLIGEIEYEGGSLDEYLPLLAAGEFLQIGTGASYGLGRYVIEGLI